MRLAWRLGALAAVNIVLGFLLQWYVLTTLGAGASTDALFAGMTIPQLVLAVVSGSLTHVLIPILSNEEGGRFHATAWTLFQAVGLFFGTVSAVLFLTADFWVAWTVPGFDPDTLALTVWLTRIQLVGMVFIALTAVLWAANHAKRQFVWVEISASIANVVSLAFLVVALPRFGIAVAAWAMTLKPVLQTLLISKCLGAYKRPDWHSPSVRVAMRRLRPLVLGAAYYKTDRLIDRILASMAVRGDLSLLHVAQQIHVAVTTVLNKAIANPAVPVLAVESARGHWDAFRRIAIRRLIAVAAVTVGLCLATILVGRPLIRFVFATGHFAAEDAATLWWLLVAFSGFVIGAAVGQVLTTSFYAQGDTKTPTQVGVVVFTIGIILKIIGFHFAGVVGIALATSLYYVLSAVILYSLLFARVRRKMRAA